MTASQIETLIRAALLAPEPWPLLERAAGLADNTRDRQLVALATAWLTGELDRVDALARDHLVDHPDSTLAVEIASATLATDTATLD